jgi:hypothetical protein
MPSFEVLIVGAPIGFTKGCRAFSSLLKTDPDTSRVLMRSAADASRNIVANSSRHDMKDEFDSLLYIFSSALHATPAIADTADIVGILDMNTYLSKDAIQVIVAACESSKQTQAANAAIMVREIIILQNNIYV